MPVQTSALNASSCSGTSQVTSSIILGYSGPSKPVREESSTAMNGRCLASPGDQADKENSDQKMSLKVFPTAGALLFLQERSPLSAS